MNHASNSLPNPYIPHLFNAAERKEKGKVHAAAEV
jgi:hypothetical protein